jgi:hypothetical protein
MSKWPMRGHFGHLHFKTFPMTPRTPQGEVFWPLAIELKIFGSPRGLPIPNLGSVSFILTLGQSGVATWGLFDHQKPTVVRGYFCWPFSLFVTFFIACNFCKLLFYYWRFIVCYFLLFLLLLVTFINYFLLLRGARGIVVLYLFIVQGEGVRLDFFLGLV